MPLEFAPPKYAVLVNAIQERITNGTYAPGQAIPSETQLMAEFNISRPTVVRSLGILQQAGWIDAQHGRGRYVRPRPPSGTGRGAPAHAAALLDQVETDTATVKLLKVGAIVAPPRARAALDLPPDSAVIARQRLIVADELGPIELNTAYVPVELAAGTGFGEHAPIGEDLLAHLGRHHGLTFTYAVERLSARNASADEAALLEVPRRECLLSLLVTVHDRSDRACMALDVLVPASRHEFEDTFPLD